MSSPSKCGIVTHDQPLGAARMHGDHFGILEDLHVPGQTAYLHVLADENGNGTLYCRPSKLTRQSIPTGLRTTMSNGSGSVSGNGVRRRRSCFPRFGDTGCRSPGTAGGRHALQAAHRSRPAVVSRLSKASLRGSNRLTKVAHMSSRLYPFPPDAEVGRRRHGSFSCAAKRRYVSLMTPQAPAPLEIAVFTLSMRRNRD